MAMHQFFRWNEHLYSHQFQATLFIPLDDLADKRALNPVRFDYHQRPFFFWMCHNFYNYLIIYFSTIISFPATS